jgi:hypothetical protein
MSMLYMGLLSQLPVKTENFVASLILEADDASVSKTPFFKHERR